MVASWLGWGAWGWLVVDSLAVYRLVRLVVRDTISQPFRRWLSRKYEGPVVEAITTCSWCLSVYAAAGVVLLTWLWPVPWSYVATGLAFSAVTGVLADRVA